MSKNKWAILHSQHSEDKTSYVEYFKANLISHLTKEHDPDGEKNQPDNILKEARASIGTLSRIFDAFPFPVPSYEKMKAISQEPDGLRNHMQGILNEVLPLLLNEDRTALNQTIIDAIGTENYKALKNSVKGKEEQIAIQFVNSIFLSYGQRILDNINDKSMKVEAFSSILSPIDTLAKELTLEGLPEPTEKTTLTAMKKMIAEFDVLIKEAHDAGITITNADKISDSILNANTWLDSDDENLKFMPEDLKIEKARTGYDKAVDFFVKGLDSTLANNKPIQPEEAHWFKKILRFITGNEKLWQSDDEKRYSRQIELMPKLSALNKQLDSLPEENIANKSDPEDENQSTYGVSRDM